MTDIESENNKNYTSEQIIEAVLFASERPLTIEQICSVFSKNDIPAKDNVKIILDHLQNKYENCGVVLKKVASGYRFQIAQSMLPWVKGLWNEKTPRYSRAFLETLAIIIYRQPVTRGEIEEIRGVAVSSNIIRTLLEREWIRVVGRKEVAGRPSMYATTRQLLDYFNLSNLSEFPTLSEVKELSEATESIETVIQKEVVDRVSDDSEIGIHVNSIQTENIIQKEEAINEDKKLLVDTKSSQAFQQTKESIDKEVFASVDELLASVKTDFVDYKEDS